MRTTTHFQVFTVIEWVVLFTSNVLFAVIAVSAKDYDCIYGGEAYWCSRLSVAKKCGVFDHCLNVVWKQQDVSNLKVKKRELVRENNDESRSWSVFHAVEKLRIVLQGTDECKFCEQVIGDIRMQLNQTEVSACCPSRTTDDRHKNRFHLDCHVCFGLSFDCLSVDTRAHTKHSFCGQFIICHKMCFRDSNPEKKNPHRCVG